MMSFSHRGITSESDFIDITTKRDFQIIIDFLFGKYGINKLMCKVKLTNQDVPGFLNGIIMLASSLPFYQQLDFQFAHELTHAIQQYQKRGLQPMFRLSASGNLEQAPYPNHTSQETEAVANSVWVIEKVLKYANYNARTREKPTYYDYEKAYALVDDGGITEIWEMNNSLELDNRTPSMV